MSNVLNDPLPTKEPVPYKDTGHPFRDWIAWKIANTEPGKPVFPLHQQLIATLFNRLGQDL